MRNSGRFLAVLAAAVLAGVLAAACGGGSGASPSSTEDTTAGSATPASGSASTTSRTAEVLFLLGHPDATGAAVRLLKGFETRINASPGPDDLVLFTVAATDGPMPQTREQIEALRGKEYGPAAILLVKTEENTDEELRKLVIVETRELLERNEVPNAADLPVLFGEDPNLALLIRGLR